MFAKCQITLKQTFLFVTLFCFLLGGWGLTAHYGQDDVVERRFGKPWMDWLDKSAARPEFGVRDVATPLPFIVRIDAVKLNQSGPVEKMYFAWLFGLIFRLA